MTAPASSKLPERLSLLPRTALYRLSLPHPIWLEDELEHLPPFGRRLQRFEKPASHVRPTRDCYVLDIGYRRSMQRTTSAGGVAFSWSVQSDVCFEDATCLFPRDLVRGSRHSAKYPVCK